MLKAAFESSPADSYNIHQQMKISCTSATPTENPIEVYNKIREILTKQPADHFVDLEFPPKPESLSKELDKFKGAGDVVWKRIHEVFHSDNLQLFGDIDPYSMKQGKLGDCHFMSAVIVLAAKPHLIRRLFHTQEYQKQGCYSIWLCDSGEWKNVIIDDYIPYKEKKKKPAFSKCTPQNLWVMLLEKAVAKLHGSYQKLQVGTEVHVLRMLTGAPAEFIRIPDDNTQSAWDTMKAAETNGFVMTVGSKKGGENKAQTKELGVISKHAYAVLGLYDINGEKLLKLRNPWGSHEWVGDWGEKSNKWTDDLKKKVDYEKQPGVFFISLADFIIHFHDISICKVHDGYQYRFYSISHDPANAMANRSVVQIKLSKKSHVYLTLHQPEEKRYKKEFDYSYSWFNMIVAKTNDKYDIEDVVDAVHYKSTKTLELTLDEGTYIVYVEFNWSQKEMQRFVMGAYSETEIEFLEITDPDPINNTNILKQMMKVCAKKPNPKIKVMDCKKEAEGSDKIKIYQGHLYGYYFNYYDNRSEHLKFGQRLKFKATGYTLCATDVANTNEAKVVVDPLDDEILLWRRDEDQESKISFNATDVVKEYYNDDDLAAKALSLEKCIVDKFKLWRGRFRHSGGEALYFSNRGENNVNCKITFKELENVQVNEPRKENNLVTFVLQPGESKLLRADIVDIFAEKKVDFSYEFEKAA
jgi:calpain-15